MNWSSKQAPRKLAEQSEAVLNVPADGRVGRKKPASVRRSGLFLFLFVNASIAGA